MLEVSGVLQRSRMGMFGLTPGSVGSALTVLYIPNRWLATVTGRFHIFTPTGMAFSDSQLAVLFTLAELMRLSLCGRPMAPLVGCFPYLALLCVYI